MAARQVVVTKNTTRKYRVPKGTKTTTQTQYKCPYCGAKTTVTKR